MNNANERTPDPAKASPKAPQGEQPQAEVKAFCKACNDMIDITNVPFIGYADEEPIVLDMQLGLNAIEEDAIDFVKKHDTWNFADWNDGNEKMWHYSKAGGLSHMEVGDETHKLEITGGFWSPL